METVARPSPLWMYHAVLWSCGCFHEGSLQLVMVCRLKVQPTFDHVFSSPPSRLTALRSLVYEHSKSSFNDSSFIALWQLTQSAL